MAAGDFSCAELVTVQVKQEEMWKDAAIQKDYVAEVDTALAIQAEQTATITPLTDMQKDYDVSISWLQDCRDDSAIGNCTDDCVVGGAEIEAICKPYTLTQCIKLGFNVKEKEFRQSTYSKEEVVARAMLKTMKILDERVARAGVAALESFAGVNQYSGNIGTVSTTQTYVPSALWDANLMGYLKLVAIKNKMTNPWMLSGENLYLQNWNTMMSTTDPNGQSMAQKMKSFRTYFDLFNVDAVLAPDKKTFLIDRGAVSLISKHYYDTTPEQLFAGPGLIRYAVKSQNIPNLYYDVTYTAVCVANDIINQWSLQARFDYLLNPTGCTATNTGVLELVCGPVPTP